MKVIKSAGLQSAQDELLATTERYKGLTSQLRELEAVLEAKKVELDSVEKAYEAALDGILEGTGSPEEAAQVKTNSNKIKEDYGSKSDLAVALARGINGIAERIKKAANTVARERKHCLRDQGVTRGEAITKKLGPLLVDYTLCHLMKTGNIIGAEHELNSLYLKHEKIAAGNYKQILTDLAGGDL